ncbi:MAG TPA: multidrug effflux MFS transporter [Rickettsiales bacterium]|nr:multidrug effflux MFS transporter [Rickettsiales bacterium]
MKQGNFLILSLLGALCVITPFAIDLYLPAFTQIAADLGTSSATVSLSLSSYFIGLAFGQFFYGPLLDRYGRKKPIYAGLALFCAASAGCMLTHDVHMLIGLRLLQGLGGCAAQVGAIAMVHDFFPVDQSARIFSRLFLYIGASPLLAPTIGSMLTAYLGWRWVFIFMLVMASAVLTCIALFLPEGHKPDKSISLKPLHIAAAFLMIFRNRSFHRYAFVSAFSFAGLFSYVAGAPIIFMEQFGVSQKMFGVLFAVLAGGFIGASQINVMLLKRFSSKIILAYALWAQVACSALLFAGTWSGAFGLVQTVVLLFGLLASVGVANPNASALALAPFTKNAGSASALMGVIQLGTGALISTSIAIVGAKTSLPIIAILFVTALAGVVLHGVLREEAESGALEVA